MLDKDTLPHPLDDVVEISQIINRNIREKEHKNKYLNSKFFFIILPNPPPPTMR